jgi:hypothetical protein
LFGTDTLTQLCICYICWTMGSSHLLRTHKATIEADANGHPIIRFSLKIRIMSAQDESDVDLQEESERVHQSSDSIYSYN